MKYIKIAVIALAVILLVSCNKADNGKEYNVGNINEQTQSLEEKEGGANIIFNGKTAEIKGYGAELKDQELLITQGGSYTLSGEFEGGVVVEVKKQQYGGDD